MGKKHGLWEEKVNECTVHATYHAEYLNYFGELTEEDIFGNEYSSTVSFSENARLYLINRPDIKKSYNDWFDLQMQSIKEYW